MCEIKKRTKQGDLQQSSTEFTERSHPALAKEKRNGNLLSDQDNDCLTNLRYADDVLLFATSKKKLQKRMYQFKESTEKVGLRIHPGKTKVLSNQSSISPDSKKEMQIGDVKLKSLQEVKA